MFNKGKITFTLLCSLSFFFWDTVFAISLPFDEGDLNSDFKTNLADLAFYFNYAAMSRDSSGSVPDNILRRIDYDGDLRLDFSDTRRRVAQNGGGIYFNPVYTHPDSLPSMSQSALALAREQLTELKALWPDRQAQLDRMLRQLGLGESPPVPLNTDLTGDGYTDVADIVRFFTLLADSLEALPGLPVAARMDFNVDGRVDLIDTEALCWRLSSDMYFQTIAGFKPGGNVFDETHDRSPVPPLGEKAARLAGRQIAWVYEKATQDITGYFSWHLNNFCRVYNLQYPPLAPLPGDINADSTRDLADAVQFFNFLYDKAPAAMYREDMDFNLDSRLDSLDAQYFLFFLFRMNELTDLPQPPGLTMSRNSKRRTVEFLECVGPSHPEWLDSSGRSRCKSLNGMLMLLPVSDSLSPDLNRDGKADVFDLLTLLRWLGNGDKRADWNGDNSSNIYDLLMFLCEAHW